MRRHGVHPVGLFGKLVIVLHRRRDQAASATSTTSPSIWLIRPHLLPEIGSGAANFPRVLPCQLQTGADRPVFSFREHIQPRYLGLQRPWQLYQIENENTPKIAFLPLPDEEISGRLPARSGNTEHVHLRAKNDAQSYAWTSAFPTIPCRYSRCRNPPAAGPKAFLL